MNDNAMSTQFTMDELRKIAKQIEKTLQQFKLSDTASNHNENPNKLKPVSNKVPPIFLHKPAVVPVSSLRSSGIKIYSINSLMKNYTKIMCQTFEDHKLLCQYFDGISLPYHTFGHPSKKKLKVVIKGLPKDTDLKEVKKELKAASIPIIRVHKMKMKESFTNHPLFVLAVAPCDEKGQKLLLVKEILGHEIKIEMPHVKIKQCHRCQKWGHTQRHCHGQIACVKCAGNHISKKCTRDAEKDPSKCANCGGGHTANYRGCSRYPDHDKLKNIIKE